MTFLFLFLLVAILIWILSRVRGGRTNILLRCSSCKAMGTLQKTKSPNETKSTDHELLDDLATDESVDNYYHYTCIQCGNSSKI